MKTENIQDIYQLTPLQHGVLFHSLYAPDTPVYFIQLCYSLRGNLNAIAFERAWQEVVARHTILRTAFYWEDLEKPLQVVNQNVRIVLQQYDWRVNQEEQEQQLQDFLESDRAQGFDFSEAPLMRLSLIHCGDDLYYFVWSKHHLILDGWSTAIVLKEVVELYQAIAQDKEVTLVYKNDYKNYIKWLQKQDSSQTEAFWRQVLNRFKAPTYLKNIQLDSVFNQDKKYENQSIKLSKTTTEALQTFARSHKLTLNIVMQGAWAILLSRYSSQEDIVFGITVSGRPTDLLGSESMVGMFINTLPTRVKVNPETFLVPWLVEFQNRQVEIYQHQYSSLVDIQSWSELSNGLPLFDNIFVFENYPIDESLKDWQENLEIQSVCAFDNSNYPLTITVIPSAELEVAIAYDCDCFEAATINRMLGHFQMLLKQMSECSEVCLKELTFLTAAEQHQLLVEWNNTKKEYPTDKLIHQLFEEQVTRSPDSIAVVFENQQLTYRELNNRANQLAHYLQNLGVKPEVTVSICIDRSLEMSIAILGVLKAGGAYIPIDPAYPSDRIAEILEDAKVEIILTQQHLETELDRHQKQLITLDSNWLDIAQKSTNNCHNQAISQNLAYVIYTSGSTGKPKGVAVNHRALVNYTLEIARQLQLKQCDRILQFASIGFDVVVEEIFPSWISGATVVLLEGQLISCSQFQQFILKQQLTIFELPTAYWHQWVSELSHSLKTVPSCVRLVIVGGERISCQTLRQWQQFKTPLIHVYGLTETTVTSTLYRLNSDVKSLELPIGSAIANTQIYLLDSYLQPVPVGVIGEIYIGGEGIARGYLNRFELTAEKFIPHLFSEKPGMRLYKTGDLARYLENGEIEYIGRIDRQVKLRGFRIELGEIEAIVSQHPAVRETVVAVSEASEDLQRIVAYVIPQTNQTLVISELRTFLESKLPTYMMPAAFITLEALPLTSNGKIDRKALPEPDTTRPELEVIYQSPQTKIEQTIADIWQKVLKLENIGIHDNFFELGGHSLLIIQVHSQVRERFQKDLLLFELFRYPTISSLAEFIGRDNNNERANLHQTDPRTKQLEEGKTRIKKFLKISKGVK
jgi:surfactin family lipopeptide synthetase C